MALTKVTYVDNVTVIGATNLNAIQDEIIANGNNISSLQSGKVDKDGNKVLSTNDFTNENLSKLNGIEAQATRVLVDTALSGSSTNAIQNKAVKEALDSQSERINNASGSVADVYTPQAYSIGDYVTHENKLYRAIVDIPTAEVWDETHWEEVNVADVVSELQEDTAEVKDIAFAGFPIDTASGAIATFSDGADNVPIKNLSVAIEPVQDLHGYDNPWPAGGGKNLLPISDRPSSVSGGGVTWTNNQDGSWTVDGTATSNSFPSGGTSMTSLGVLTGGDYTASLQLADGTLSSNVQSRIYKGSTSIGGTNNTTFTVPDGNTDTYYLTFRVPSGTTVSNETIYPQFEVGSAITPYTPYENICPISGHTEANVTRTGKNLMNDDPNTFNAGFIDNQGNVNSSPTYVYSNEYVPCLPNSDLSVSYIRATETQIACTIGFYDVDKHFINRVLIHSADSVIGYRSKTVTVPENAAYFRITSIDKNKTNLQIEVSSSPTAYEPYRGTTYPITFPSGTGTVYGGNITVNQDGTGELVVTHKAVDFGTLTWGYNSTNNYGYVSVPSKAFGNRNVIATAYKTSNANNTSGMQNGEIKGNASNSAIYVKDARFTSAEEYQAGLDGVIAVYELATPVNIPLTASQITTLLGTNYLWADCNGDVSVIYRADTQMYIGEEIAETNSSLETLLPSAIVTKRAYIQNGEISQNDRTVSIKDGVLTASSSGTATTARLGIIITGEMSYSSSTVSSFTPPINSLLPVINGVNATRTLIYDNATTANVPYAIIYWCNISNDTVNVVERTELWANTDKGLVLKQFTIPETATHYAIRIYWATAFEQTNKVRMEFTAI